MSSSGSSLPAGGTPAPISLTPFLRAVQARDIETLSMLRHTLRTPLNQIIGYSEMLMESAEENNITSILLELRRIHTCGGQLLAVISDALAAWRIESGVIDFAGMRRDMRVPLDTIIGHAELCLEKCGVGQEELTSDLEKILRAAHNLDALFANEQIPEQIDVGPAPVENENERANEPAAMVLPVRPIGEAHDFGFSTHPMPNARLLAVDDDAMNRDMLIRRLQKLGYDVSQAATGREALQRLKDGNFDLVLLDILMPDLDGFQTLEFMKADPRLRHVPVIMLTALGDDEESTVRCIEAGAEDYVPKPFNPVILRARISASLEKKRLRDQEQAYLVELQMERSKSDRLLLNVLPKAIADRLKAGQRTIVDSFIDATVLFADIVGFTRITAKQSPHRTVQLLNEIFSSFDRIAENLNLEKIKTVGDAYMMVSGVPVIRPDHAESMAVAAFEMLDAVRLFNRRHQLDWNIRVGMNSGPVVAGIIGTKKFSYDLWGDTVNIASRMESHGRPGHLQVSAATKELLGDKYEFQPMGLIEIKNSAPMPTFLVHRPPGK